MDTNANKEAFSFEAKNINLADTKSLGDSGLAACASNPVVQFGVFALVVIVVLCYKLQKQPAKARTHDDV